MQGDRCSGGLLKVLLSHALHISYVRANGFASSFRPTPVWNVLSATRGRSCSRSTFQSPILRAETSTAGATNLNVTKRGSEGKVVGTETSIERTSNNRLFWHLQGFHDELPDVDPRPLIVVDRISHVAIHPAEQAENREKLRSVSSQVRRPPQMLPQPASGGATERVRPGVWMRKMSIVLSSALRELSIVSRYSCRSVRRDLSQRSRGTAPTH